VARRAQIQVVLEQGQQLGADKTHLRGQLHVELAQVHQSFGDRRIQGDDCFPYRRPFFVPPKAQDVDARVRGEGAERRAQRRRERLRAVLVTPAPGLAIDQL
jgi:hypothetical protein